MSKKPLYICDGKRNCFNMPCYEECHLTHDINHAVRDENGEPIIAEYYDDEEVKITAHALIDALDSVVWYNGLGETLRKWRHTDPHNQEAILPFTMYWNNEIDPDEYYQLQVIWMICVVLFGDYGTSPRSGWINDWDGFRDFIDKVTATYMEAEK